MKWREVAASTGAQADVFAVLIASLPIVYRVSVILKELKPDIQEWLRAQAARAQADTEALEQLEVLVDRFEELATVLRDRDDRVQEHHQAQDQALIELLKRMDRPNADDT